MDILNLNDRDKLELLSKDFNFFGEEVFNKYCLLKVNGKYYIDYKRVYINGEFIHIINKIDGLTSVNEVDNTRIEVKNYIVIGSNIEGFYENGYKFCIPNITLITKGFINDEENVHFRERVAI